MVRLREMWQHGSGRTYLQQQLTALLKNKGFTSLELQIHQKSLSPTEFTVQDYERKKLLLSLGKFIFGRRQAPPVLQRSSKTARNTRTKAQSASH